MIDYEKPFDERYSISELDRLYFECDQADKNLFAEMRSNILLVSGEHYSRRNSQFLERIRTSHQLDDRTKIRLTKNHIQRIMKVYSNAVLDGNPGSGFRPHNESELQDQKTAELNRSVWLDAVQKYDIEKKRDQWCDDFFHIGECGTYLHWDPNLGRIKGYEQKVVDGVPQFEVSIDQVTGQPVQGAPIPDPNLPVFTGEFVWERLFGFNVLRPEHVQDFDDAPYLFIRKVVTKESLLQTFGKDKDKASAIKKAASSDQAFVIFDPQINHYRSTTKDELILKMWFLRPCAEKPNGWVCMWVDAGGGSKETGKLHEGELPGGIFPIVMETCEQIQTTPRGRSIIKQLRPYQVEINRKASKIAEHQITLGDDKIITQYGGKMTAGAVLPGVRHFSVNGAAPMVLEGRSGAQYLDSLNADIAEMYAVANLEYVDEDSNATQDPMAILYQAASKKKRFRRYVSRFERFFVRVTKLHQELAKIHLPEDTLIKIIGRNETVNIPEFKNSSPLCYDVIIEPQTDDIETKLGKQMLLNTALQYVGNKLERDDIGKLLKLMPYANFEESFSDFTLDHDSITNDILALDRGEQPPVGEFDNHVLFVKRLVARMRQADFKMLPPQVQQNYMVTLQQHEQAEVIRQRKIQAATADFIPTDGPLIGVDIWVRKADDPAKTERARLPDVAIRWLIQRLEDQGANLLRLQGVNEGALAQMAVMSQGQGALQSAGTDMLAQGDSLNGGQTGLI